MTIRHTVVSSPLDDLTLVADGDALVGLYFRHHWYRPATVGIRVDVGRDDLFAETRTQLGDYFTGARTHFDLPTDLRGDAGQRRVWQRLATIPYGETVSYGDIAGELADGSTARAVGAAVGRNPISIVVPCHRVVGKGGSLTGYAGGLRRKRYLLDLEEPAAARAGRLF